MSNAATAAPLYGDLVAGHQVNGATVNGATVERSKAVVLLGDDGDCTLPMFEDYGVSDHQAHALHRHKIIARRDRDNVVQVWWCGWHLNAARNESELGTFTKWLKSCAIPTSTAYRYMALAEHYPDVSHVGKHASLTQAYRAAGIVKSPKGNGGGGSCRTCGCGPFGMEVHEAAVELTLLVDQASRLRRVGCTPKKWRKLRKRAVRVVEGLLGECPSGVS